MIDGIINVRKEKGFTSHDVVAKLRGITRQKKIGHTGTLDPDATGVLPVCFGKATKLCDMLTEKEKAYEAVLLLGKTTDTQDISGEVKKECSVEGITQDQVRETILSFVGEYDQIPPMYSALKVNGKKLYELAREGVEIERKPRKIQIHRIEIREINLPEVRFEVWCSKGTYIRTLCNDIGEKLGCGGCMSSLIRTKSGIFTLEESKSLDEIETCVREGRIEEILVPIDAMFPDVPKVFVKEGEEKSVYNGNALTKRQLEENTMPQSQERIRVYQKDGLFLALYRYDSKENRYKVEKMFYSPRQQ
ncbi:MULTISPECIES: tRNA pseudouridine(55) synthase TruB [Sellimonas]|uniref:tRNA pseudouridine synthase B n=1 Tax=Sellimonas caecigallum TaxID=2592333 RepID=A0ABS7L6B5_9FIRM|nr:tRNA pseudouridine(55) synthase TruB [Sellimonas caecigallum]MBY0758603.1 tRNA pseudouridine(55) synthase TruB [Sellimonas caecigallum]OUP64827.1 tRNA pseudouridine(55) synthase TruB [Drancourtella sp. An177]